MPRPSNVVSERNLTDAIPRRNRKRNVTGAHKPAHMFAFIRAGRAHRTQSPNPPGVRAGRQNADRPCRRRLPEGLIEHLGGIEGMDFITRELIEQCVHMKTMVEEIRVKRAAGRTSDYDSKRFSAAFNSLQRASVRLGYKEKAAIARVRAEAELQRAMQKK
jgi:hypothetical protein